MISIRSSYHPIDAAILWCNLAEHEAEILQVELSNSGRLLTQFPQWPFLHMDVERLYDAVICGEVAVTFLSRPITVNNQRERVYWSIRHSDLRAWLGRHYPQEKPVFLFPKII